MQRCFRASSLKIRETLLLIGCTATALLTLVLVVRSAPSPALKEAPRVVAQAAPATREQAASPEPPAPAIYTFWQPAWDFKKQRDDNDKKLLQVWEAEWRRAGFDPRIVTEADAKRHPFHDFFKAQLDKHRARGGLGISAQYDYYCYIRYLAMAQVGGGWMSDYDVLPLYIAPSPGDGRFHVYLRQTPALVKGNASEYFRVFQLMVAAAVARTDGRLFSDMMALQSVYAQSHAAFDSTVDVAMFADEGSPRFVLARPDQCNLTKGKLAVHIAHRVIYEKGSNMTLFDRGEKAEWYIGQWRRKCAGS